MPSPASSSQPPRATRHHWDTLPADRPMALLERRRVIGQRAMISRVVLQKGCAVPLHAHENEQIACILSGRLHFRTGEGGRGEEFTLGPGEVLHLPSNCPHSADAVEDTVVLDIFSPPSETTGIDRGH
jgi:quercetin dioxygenase-like cupin family protein